MYGDLDLRPCLRQGVLPHKPCVVSNQACCCLVSQAHVSFWMPQKELKEIERDKTSGVTVQVVGANLQRLTGFVNGKRHMHSVTPKAC
jgi:hypothetical protein